MSQSVATREKIFEAAMQVFSERGYWKTRVSDIVQAAGVAQGTFYLYYPSKEECFRSIISHVHEQSILMVREVVAESAGSDVLFNAARQFLHRFRGGVGSFVKVFLFESLSAGRSFQDQFLAFKASYVKEFRGILAEYHGISEEPELSVKLQLLVGLLMEMMESDVLILQESEEKIEKNLRLALEYIVKA